MPLPKSLFFTQHHKNSHLFTENEIYTPKYSNLACSPFKKFKDCLFTLKKNPSWILLSVSISIGKKYAKMTLKSEKMPHAPLSHRTLMSYNQNVSNLI